MPPTPSELLRSATSTMTALADHFDAVDEIEEKRKNAKTQLDAVVKELAWTSTKLNATKVELKKTEEALEQKYHIINDEKARALRDIDDQIKARLEELKKVQTQIADARSQHENILAGLRELNKRIRV